MRSKALLLANIFATLLSITVIGSTVLLIYKLGDCGGLAQYAKEYSAAGFEGFVDKYIYLGPFLLIAESVILLIATAIGWTAWYKKNCKMAIIFASLYLVGILFYILYAIESLPVILLGFVGAYNQKKLNSGKGNNNTTNQNIDIRPKLY